MHCCSSGQKLFVLEKVTSRAARAMSLSGMSSPLANDQSSTFPMIQSTLACSEFNVLSIGYPVELRMGSVGNRSTFQNEVPIAARGHRSLITTVELGLE